jgi:adenine phosphoribosyltransferase
MSSTSSNQPKPQVSTSSEQQHQQPAALTTTEAAILASSSSTASGNNQDASGRQPAASSTSSSELASTKISLLGALRRFPDFPIPGINFIDILPIFQDPAMHNALLRALELQVAQFGSVTGGAGAVKPDVVVGLDARGFLFGPSLALRLDASFVPVRKQGKLPGPCVTATYEKEYGQDFFQMQEGAIKPGQKVLVVDDIIATGKTDSEEHASRVFPLAPPGHSFSYPVSKSCDI